LKEFIKSLKEVSSFVVDQKSLKFKIIFTTRRKAELKNTKLYDYILWGEIEGFHKNPTCLARESDNRDWFNLENISGEYLFNMSTGDRYLIPYNPNLLPIDARLYAIKLKQILSIEKQIALGAILNSSYLPLFYEIFGRPMTGSLPLLDLKVYELLEFIPIVNLNYFSNKCLSLLINIVNDFKKRIIRNIFEEFGFKKDITIRDQKPNPQPDRKALDDIIFDALGLTEEERKEIYWAVAELVQNRLQKARSV
jgi:hypothetical protein